MSCQEPIDPECPCGKCPEVEIPFTPPDPPECDGTECVEIYDGACVKYTGPDLTCAGITTGMTLNTLVETFAGLLCACNQIP